MNSYEDPALSYECDLTAEIERLRAERDSLSALSTYHSERANRAEAERDQLRELMNIYNLGGWTDSARLIAERDALRSTLQELRIRLHAAGRRPEECYEMSLIDAALARLALAREWIADRPHTANCTVHGSFAEKPRCGCGRDALLAALEEPK